MTYYWLVAQHSGKVLEADDDSVDNRAKIVQHTKKLGNDTHVNTQLWSFNEGFIINKKSGLVINITENKHVIQNAKHEPSNVNQWEYNRENNTINLKSDQNLVLDILDGSKDDGALIILQNKHGGQSQRFILEKWNNDTIDLKRSSHERITSSNFSRLITEIVDSNKFLPTLSQNLLEILNDDEFYDITIEVGSDPHVKVFHAHMVILCYRSPYLRRILLTDKKKNDGTLAHVKLPNILPENFEIILRYLYGGRFSLEEYDTSEIIKILVASNELGLQELISYIQYFLIENKADWIEQNIILVHQISYENESFMELQKYCADLISKEPDKVFKSSDFLSVPEKLLVSLLQADNLQMSEFQIWEYVLKWGFAQNPELSSDPASLSKNDFKVLKNTLQQCVPFIRFQNLSSKEFSEALPYRKILPKELYTDLLNTFINDDNKPSKPRIPKDIKKINSKDIDSKIITLQQAELISKWVDQLENTTLKSSLEFKLLFRGSRDGFLNKKFHEICDNQSRTVTIVKVKNSNEILGGYNPNEWNSNGNWGVTKNSFIFSFKDENHILSRILNEIIQ